MNLLPRKDIASARAVEAGISLENGRGRCFPAPDPARSPPALGARLPGGGTHTHTPLTLGGGQLPVSVGCSAWKESTGCGRAQVQPR